MRNPLKFCQFLSDAARLYSCGIELEGTVYHIKVMRGNCVPQHL